MRQRAAPGRKIYGTEWRKRRVIALRRDRGLCVLCLADGRAVPATDVDHIVAVEHGGTDELSNLQSLCTPCHCSKMARERQQRN
ncbi:TPA: HNH endonuclease [Salmonella enterica]|nr:HNH endonuclease [Salmonella enterica]HDC2659341.1 HNH endonuclease [Salmonella enterica]